MDDLVEQTLEDIIPYQSEHQASEQEQQEQEMGGNSLPIPSPSQDDVRQENLNAEEEEKLGHMCIVLNPKMRKQLVNGEPIIVGTSHASVEAFFHRMIAACQMGTPMPVIFQQLSGAVTVANIKKGKTGIISNARTDRYPVPRGGSAGKRSKGQAAPSMAPTSGLPAAEDEPSTSSLVEKSRKNSDRDEIPLEAVRLYLTEKRYFPGWGANAKRNLRKRTKDFKIDPVGTILYRNKRGVYLPCIEDKAERMTLIWEAHVMDHRRRDGLLNTLREKYYWKGMFHDVNTVLDSCEVCGAQRNQRSKDREDREGGSPDLGDYEQPTKSKRIRTKKSTEFVDKPSTPEPSDSEKYPETSEVALVDRSGD
ncbi:hypothetical protein BV898_14079 [Hypsibius exemplaris]|uniref:Integrase zinc-binding domain-containing protein n=1 Tax=Hypsibius exemplaris TaxID=2072580 RepID=A0A1W0W8Y0_HYPEX|nr:hypothetical protein BV898_14079 [Hypsibius exemplaris]